ncbi:uncharacterized protein LOC141540913 [Sminthopsis crassicaudata]|uniref:uncharacterized protein LOC141540913 n=1 Tax=Sminthopsis crassicaudata TaxID=9301 RepID=UPI003D68ADCD
MEANKTLTPLISPSTSNISLEPRTIFISPSMPSMPSHTSIPTVMTPTELSPISSSITIPKYKPGTKIPPCASRSAPTFPTAQTPVVIPKHPHHGNMTSKVPFHCNLTPISEYPPATKSAPITTTFPGIPTHKYPSTCSLASTLSWASSLKAASFLSTSPSFTIPPTPDTIASKHSSPRSQSPSDGVGVKKDPSEPSPKSDPDQTSTPNCAGEVIPGTPFNYTCAATSTPAVLLTSRATSTISVSLGKPPNCVSSSPPKCPLSPKLNPSISRSISCVLLPGHPSSSVSMSTSTSTLNLKTSLTSRATSISASFSGIPSNSIFNSISTSVHSNKSPSVSKATSICELCPGVPSNCMCNTISLCQLSPKSSPTSKVTSTFNSPKDYPSNCISASTFSPKSLFTSTATSICEVLPGIPSNCMCNSTPTTFSPNSPPKSKATSTCDLLKDHPSNCICNSTSTSTLSPKSILTSAATSICDLFLGLPSNCIRHSTSAVTLTHKSPPTSKATHTCDLPKDYPSNYICNSTLKAPLSPKSPPTSKATSTRTLSFGNHCNFINSSTPTAPQSPRSAPIPIPSKSTPKYHCILFPQEAHFTPAVTSTSPVFPSCSPPIVTSPCTSPRSYRSDGILASKFAPVSTSSTVSSKNTPISISMSIPDCKSVGTSVSMPLQKYTPRSPSPSKHTLMCTDEPVTSCVSATTCTATPIYTSTIPAVVTSNLESSSKSIPSIIFPLFPYNFTPSPPATHKSETSSTPEAPLTPEFPRKFMPLSTSV